MTIFAPAKCPKCGCGKIEMEVITWGMFDGGKFEIVNEGPGVRALDVAVAVCMDEKCGHEWQWEQV